ncbi:hypothetical protein ASPCAL14311 [Aspergillus calidoustus]|uniref:ZZ-type domain-containing protein n=1 Tax=Aspergillus calidoustus TaxID=454130 RepID=A0A0U5GJU0_ASPCI|nr:hypothetical protein ASPCAL14311 [Aspergillus calidoustus]
MRELMNCGAEFNHDGKLPSAVFGAVSNGRLEALKVLLDRGADLSALNTDGSSILHHAARHGAWDELVQLLIDHGADPHVVAYNEQTALHQTAGAAFAEVESECNRCSSPIPEKGMRYICTECPNINLCASCMRSYESENLRIKICRGQNFWGIEVSKYRLSQPMREGKEKGLEMVRAQWLRNLIKIFTVKRRMLVSKYLYHASISGIYTSNLIIRIVPAPQP